MPKWHHPLVRNWLLPDASGTLYYGKISGFAYCIKNVQRDCFRLIASPCASHPHVTNITEKHTLRSYAQRRPTLKVTMPSSPAPAALALSRRVDWRSRVETGGTVHPELDEGLRSRRRHLHRTQVQVSASAALTTNHSILVGGRCKIWIDIVDGCKGHVYCLGLRRACRRRREQE